MGKRTPDLALSIFLATALQLSLLVHGSKYGSWLTVGNTAKGVDPTPNWDGRQAVFDNRLYMFGGHTSTRSLDEFFIYDLLLHKWTSMKGDDDAVMIMRTRKRGNKVGWMMIMIMIMMQARRRAHIHQRGSVTALMSLAESSSCTAVALVG